MQDSEERGPNLVAGKWIAVRSSSPPLSPAAHIASGLSLGGCGIEGDKQCFPVGCARLLVPVSPRPAGPCWRGRGAQRPPTVWGTEGAGQQPHSPALAAASTKVPSPWLWKRKLGPFSLSQKISEALLLRMGPTLTPRPPRRRHQPTVSGGSKASGLRGGRGCL